MEMYYLMESQNNENSKSDNSASVETRFRFTSLGDYVHGNKQFLKNNAEMDVFTNNVNVYARNQSTTVFKMLIKGSLPIGVKSNGVERPAMHKLR